MQEYYELANSHTYRPPNHSSYDELERKYWKSLSFCPPIYGCDVADRLTDPDVKEWNIAELGSILDLIKEDNDIDIKVL
jgi:jumonji domain-containing protein 2